VTRSLARLFARRDGSASSPPGRLRAAERLEHAHRLDGAAAVLAGAVRRAVPAGPRADILHGVPIGQPAHPALVGLPLGFWASAAVLDFVPGSGRATRALIALGLASAIPAAATGWADWADLHREQQRVGLVHAASGACAGMLFAASLLARSTGRAGSGRALSLAGLAAGTAGGFLGRHLAFPMGAGASHAEPVIHLAPLGWHDLCPLSELPDGRVTRRSLGYLSLVVLRDGAAISVLDDQCAHLGGPLHQGELTEVNGRPCIVCPWHGSTFRLADGSVARGPATARQPAFEVRVTGGQVVQVRPQHSGPDRGD
jgi:nitrite reductase/ring-hydroxylating ferredoxin subunit/uncharacterized membrane protein